MEETQAAKAGTEPKRPRPFWRRATALVVLAALTTGCYGLMWGLPNLFDVAADSVTPNGELASRTRDFLRVTAHRYPPLHFDVLRLAFQPADLVARAPVFAANIKLRSTLYIWTARAVSLLMGVAAVVAVHGLTRRLFGDRAALLAALVFGLNPAAQFYMKNANLDMPYTMWLALALLALERFLSGSPGALLWAALASVAAVGTKDQAYAAALLLAAPVLASLRRRDGSWRGVTGDRTAWAAVAAAAAAFVLIHRIPFSPLQFIRHVQVAVGPASEGWRETTRDLAGQARLLTESLLWLASLMTPAGLALAAAGAVIALKRRRGGWLLWSPLGYWLTFLAVVGYVYPRFLLPVVLALAPLAGLAADALCRWRPAGRPVGAFLAGLAAAWIAAVGCMVLYDMDEDTRQAAQFWLEEHVPVTRRVGCMGDMRDMPRLNRPDLEAHRVAQDALGWLDADAMQEWAERTGREPTGRERERFAWTPDVLIVSIETRGALLASALNTGEWLLERLGSWGRADPRAGPGRGPGFAGYRLAAEFRPAFGGVTPAVSPSFGRVIRFYLRAEAAPSL